MDPGVERLIIAIALLITAIASPLAALIAAYAAYLGRKNAANIDKIEKATNSMKDELVKSTAAASQALGELKGRADTMREREGG